MKGKQLENSGNHVDEGGGEASKCGLNQMSKEFTSGDIVWIKIRGNSWWPAQVVEGNSKVRTNGISRNLEGKIRVRLYGSYEYMHVDPMKYRTEFENLLKKNNWDSREILKESLEQELSRVKTSTGIKRKLPASKESSTVEASTMKKRRKDKVQKNQVKSPSPKLQHDITHGMKAKQSSHLVEKAGSKSCESKRSKQQKVNTRHKADGQDTATESLKNVQELSARRVKVMQGLGLMAPSGSPFRRNGFHKFATP